MGDRFHVATLVWGLVLTGWGVFLLGVGLDWWQFDLMDLRFVGPALIIVVGVAVLVGAMSSRDEPES